MKRQYWELAGEGHFRKGLLGAVLGGMALVNIGLCVGTLVVEAGPRYAARTDREGNTDLVALPADVEATLPEAQRFLESVVLRLFAWDDTTKAEDRGYVLSRLSSGVRIRLKTLVPGYATSLAPGTHGRVDVEMVTTRVVSDRLPYRIEVQLAVEFTGDYAPLTTAEPDPEGRRRQRYGYLVELGFVGRTAANPTGLLVNTLTSVQLVGESR